MQYSTTQHNTTIQSTTILYNTISTLLVAERVLPGRTVDVLTPTAFDETKGTPNPNATIACGHPKTCVSPAVYSRVRTFGVLNARRPKVSEESDAKNERRRPDWMPPTKVFPFIWITIGILRAVSSTMVSCIIDICCIDIIVV